jgi:pantoate--beta-alanine ligase
MIQVLKAISDVKAARNNSRKKNLSIGFVPTMGALHEGHLDLVRRAKSENDVVFVSIFVNPTQFNDPKDLEKYPRTFEKDLALLSEAGTDYLFYPDSKSMYPDEYRYKLTENDFSKKLCGASRAGHFDGVLTVVMKLLQIVSPHNAYFGEKDYQQLKLIEGMAEAFFLDTRIIGCPTVRESDGLAMSSRNVRLSPSEREKAPQLYKIISTAKSDNEARKELEAVGFRVDYVETHENRRFGAVFLGEVRLIDNVQI